MTCCVLHIQIFLLNHQRLLKSDLSERQLQFLKALGLDPSVFTDPDSKPIIIPPKVVA